MEPCPAAMGFTGAVTVSCGAERESGLDTIGFALTTASCVQRRTGSTEWWVPSVLTEDASGSVSARPSLSSSSSSSDDAGLWVFAGGGVTLPRFDRGSAIAVLPAAGPELEPDLVARLVTVGLLVAAFQFLWT